MGEFVLRICAYSFACLCYISVLICVLIYITGGPIKATVAMWRCSRIMQMQRELHPTMLASLEGILDQLLWFRENWCEEAIRQLRQALNKCYQLAYDNRPNVAEATITPQIVNFIKKLDSTLGRLEQYCF